MQILNLPQKTLRRSWRARPGLMSLEMLAGEMPALLLFDAAPASHWLMSTCVVFWPWSARLPSPPRSIASENE